MGSKVVRNVGQVEALREFFLIWKSKKFALLYLFIFWENGKCIFKKYDTEILEFETAQSSAAPTASPIKMQIDCGLLEFFIG